MLKKLNQIINIIMGLFSSIYISHVIYVFWYYKAYPDLYPMQSAPWYISIFVYSIVMLILLTIAVIGKMVIGKKMK